MRSPSNHLLRVLAAVPVSSKILDLGCGAGLHTEALLRLGFEVEACDAREEAVAATRERVASMGAQDNTPACEVSVASIGDLDYADGTFDWVVAHMPKGYVTSSDSLAELLTRSRRLLKSGGWVYVAVSDNLAISPDQLSTLGQDAGLAEASAPEVADEHGQALVRAIFRRVDEGTPR